MVVEASRRTLERTVDDGGGRSTERRTSIALRGYGLCRPGAFGSLTPHERRHHPPPGPQSEHPSRLSDDELIQRLNDHRRGSGEWAAVLGEIQRRSDRHASDARFKAALASADDDVSPAV